MPITILPPSPAVTVPRFVPAKHPDHSRDDSSSYSSSDEIDAEAIARSSKRRKTAQKHIVTPGELITTDAQWMRGHGTFNPYSGRSDAATPSTDARSSGPDAAPAIAASVFGTIQRTNKLVSVAALRARYAPEIGDLVVGRVAEVQARRWKVDVAAPLLAALPLSAINLPGGILRRRTAVDELNVRGFFAEGDLLVAEVQAVQKDGSAALHTRSLKFGKLRNGFFMSVSGAGGGGAVRKGGVVRSRRQVFPIKAGRGGEEIEVILGVNGYIWIQKRAEPPKDVGITKLEEVASQEIYENRNDDIPVQTRREIARVASCINALVEAGKRVDEDAVVQTYKACLEMEEYAMDEDGEGYMYLGGEKGDRVVEAAMSGQ